MKRRAQQIPTAEAEARAWLHVHLWGARQALAAAEAATAPLERHLNRTLAIRQLGLALRRLPPEAREQVFRKDTPP